MKWRGVDAEQGTSFGGFIIRELLGRGGMGVVYRATRTSDGREVALKLMLPEISANDDFRERFVREAKISPALDHPNIVRVYETGEVDSELFIAMELVRGHDLKSIIGREGALPVRRAVAILEQAGLALDTAHESGIVHGDVKPQNLMITRSGEEKDRVLLTDFGLIRPMGSESSASRSGSIFGSIQYMAPEQIEGIQADGRADVYSLACVAFETLSGRIPFDRPNEVGVIWAHIHEEPPRVTDENPTLPSGLNEVLHQAMSKHPEDRFLTCGEFVEALHHGAKKSASAILPAGVRPLVNRRKRLQTEREVWSPNFFPELSRVRKASNRTNWRAAIVTMAALIFLPSAIAQMVHPEGVAGAAGDVGGAVASFVPDIVSGAPLFAGREVDDLLPAAKEGSRTTSKRKSAPERTLVVPGHQSLPDRPRPDPQEVEGGPVLEADPQESGPQSTAAIPSLSGKIAFATWRHAGTNRSMTGGEIYLMNPDGSGLERLTFTDPTVQEYAPAISPDGQQVVFQRSMDIDNADLFLMSSKGGAARQLTAGPECEYWPSWSPNGTKILFGRVNTCTLYDPGDLWMLDLATGAEVNLTPSTPQTDDWGGTWSPDGSQILFTKDSDIYVMDAEGGPASKLASGWDADWCRGGYVVYAEEEGLWRYDLKTSEKVLLTRNVAQYDDAGPTCSPDGQHIMFETFRDGHWQIYLMNADGSNEINVTRSPSGEHLPDWQAMPPKR